ncbi:hypothetical protein C4K68_08550 [Pokkaliibacter plantistimulans]|uniref:Lipoprotein n=1 Tax=Proteobacteria bacterium 228 TaxID=2083153 RepID=A0A2S5KSI8_9PROT|nr:hypothetical protein [Pokkaliibacter plantistimulans]PPC77821.1 hypothetical protein C4K68_08550 [Pokkaliibacter plantistimulans]
MKKALLTTVTLTAALSGCASTGSYEYKTNHSRAYNIAEAGGLVTGIQDASVPRDTLERLTDTKTFGAAYVLSGYMSPKLGMTDWQGGLINLANWAIGPKQHGSRNSLIAWMPEEEASSTTDAQAKLLSHVKVSIEESLSSLGADYALLYEKGGDFTYHFYKQEWKCPKWKDGISKISDMCSIRVRVIEPRKSSSPAFLSPAKTSYAFTSGGATQYNRINISNGSNSVVPQQIIYAEISKKLPTWVYLYLSPNSVQMEDGNKVNIPYLLEAGKPELFIYPSI